MHKPVIILVGQTPPPHNGQANMIALMKEGLAASFEIHHVRMAFSDSVDQAGRFGFRKIEHLFSLILQTRRLLRKHPGAWLYYPPASPNWVPIIRDILFLSMVRPLAGGVIFHFHAGGLAAWLRRHSLMRRVGGLAFKRPDLAIQLGPSCPPDGAGLEAVKTRIIPYGLNLEAVPPEQPGSGPLRILYVGIHTEAKGIFDLLETARLLRVRGVPFEMKTAGRWYGKQEQRKFERIRKQYKLEEAVLPVGEKTGAELWSLYAWADVLFFPTHYPWETCGIVQLEAMAHGLPVVATDWPGPRDVVRHGETGWLVPPRDATAMADAIERLANNPAERLRLGVQGKKRYEEAYTADIFMGRMRAALLDLANEAQS